MYQFLTAFLVLLLAGLLWKIKKLFEHDPVINFSKTSTPFIKNNVNVVFYDTEKWFMLFRKFAKVLKESYRHDFFSMPIYNVIKAKDAEKLLNSSKHSDKSMFYYFLRPFLKTGLLISNGDKWHKRRRMLTPTFHFEILKEFFEVFKEESDRFVKTMKTKVGEEIDLLPICSQFTLNMICESALGVKLEEIGSQGVNYRKAIRQISEKLTARIMKPWIYADFLYSLFGYRKEFEEVSKPSLDFTKMIINHRREHFSQNLVKNDEKSPDSNVYFGNKKRRYAMLDTLLQAQQRGEIDDEGIIEETDTFTFEGHDTTSTGLTFTLLLLAQHPEAQEKIFEELQRIIEVTGNDEPTIGDFNKMEYLDRVIKESLRIYPPVPMIGRKFTEDFSVDGFKFVEGNDFTVHIYDIHRDPDYFPDPEKFDPDRFLPENCANRSNFAFIAFSAGVRNCIGQRFAMLELKVVIVKIIRSLKILPVTKREEITFFADLALRPKNPILIKFLLR